MGHFDRILCVSRLGSQHKYSLRLPIIGVDGLARGDIPVCCHSVPGTHLVFRYSHLLGASEKDFARILETCQMIFMDVKHLFPALDG